MRKDISVLALMRNDGTIFPKQIYWDDGREFYVDKILDIRKASSTKGGGMGIRYTCKICGKEKYLFLDNNIWFVEI